MQRMGLILTLVLVMHAVALAQTGGQFCVRAFEDRNGNGQHDAGEPLLTRGLGVDLLDAEGVILASALLDNSPTAAQGVVCFQFLAEGQYTLSVTSAEYTATTSASMTASISAGGLPTVFEFGGQRTITDETAPPATSPAINLESDLLRIGAAAIGALVVIAGMAVLGFLVYWFGLRNRAVAQTIADARRTTGSLPAVPVEPDDVPEP